MMGEAEEIDPLIDATIGNYKVTRKIGEGGMGAVYLAVHPLIGKKVALKVLHSEFSMKEDVVTRFFNEAKAVNDIQHPNIVDIIDYGVIPNPRGDMVYFIMEHLDGHPLEDVIAEQAPLSPARSLHICVQVADALAASHNSNIIHRDLKPDNIILIKKRNNDDFVKLLDFGIAKLTGNQPGSSKTRTGIVMGTPAYMSPEQCEGKGNIDNRTDVYALGIVLYKLITGRVPFEGEGYGEILVQHLTQRPKPPSTLQSAVPPHVEAICLKALNKNPDNRFQNMEDFIEALTDPVGFVEANGGLEHFNATDLVAPVLPSVTQERQSNELGLYTPAPGSLHSAANTQYPDDVLVKKNWLPLIVGVGAMVGIGVIAALLMTGEDNKKGALDENVASSSMSKKDVEKVAPVKPEVTIPATEVKTKVVAVWASVTSNPSGAEIYGPMGFIGKTPSLLKDFDSDDFPITLVLKRVGYEAQEIAWEFNAEQKKQRYNLPEVQLKRLVKAKTGKKRSVRSKSRKEHRKVKDNTMAPEF